MSRISPLARALPAIALAACGKGDPQASTTGGATATAGATASAAPAAVAKPAPPPAAATTAPAGGAAGACGYDGAYVAVGYACKGEKQKPFPPFMQWNFTMKGTDAPFTQTMMPPLPSCSLTEVYKGTCAGSPTVLTLTPMGPSTCSPSNCMMHKTTTGVLDGTACNKVPAPILWSLVEHTATTLVLTSVEPFKLTTCTGSHKSNPLTVWWQKK